MNIIENTTKLLKEPIPVINEKYKAEFHHAKNHFSSKKKNFLKIYRHL